MKDDLGDRMKSYYEDRTRISLPRRTFTIIRIDGKAFHTYTQGLKRPFDVELIEDMDLTTKFLCENIQGAKFAYVQSDEISIALTDFDKITTDAWFNGNLQKMASISASLATSQFNKLRMSRKLSFIGNNAQAGLVHLNAGQVTSKDITIEMMMRSIAETKLAQFDSRVFTIPFEEDVINYFIWRQQDATRNSISAVAQSLYSHKELNGKTTDMMQELIFQKGQNWNNYPDGQKRGRVIMKRPTLHPVTDEVYNKAKDKSNFVTQKYGTGFFVTRNAWQIIDPPIFTQDKDFLRKELTKKGE